MSVCNSSFSYFSRILQAKRAKRNLFRAAASFCWNMWVLSGNMWTQAVFGRNFTWDKIRVNLWSAEFTLNSGRIYLRSELKISFVNNEAVVQKYRQHRFGSLRFWWISHFGCNDTFILRYVYLYWKRFPYWFLFRLYFCIPVKIAKYHGSN